jgi:hypothetical protein
MPGNFCPNCGSPLSDNVKFCPSCGSSVGAASAPPPPPSAPTPSAPTPPPSYNNTQPGNNYQAPQYQQPYNQQQYNNYQRPAAPQQNNYQPLQPDLSAPMSIGQYILTMIVFGIPIVGFIMMLVWSFSSSTNINKKNYARATLIMAIIGAVLMIICWSLIIGIITSIVNSGSYGTYY